MSNSTPNLQYQLKMPNSTPNHSVLLDHQMTIDGVIFYEHMDVHRVIIYEEGDAVDYSILSHTKKIGDLSYCTKKRMVNGASNGEETIETNMTTPEEIENFKMEWDTNREVSSLFYEGV